SPFNWFRQWRSSDRGLAADADCRTEVAEVSPSSAGSAVSPVALAEAEAAAEAAAAVATAAVQEAARRKEAAAALKAAMAAAGRQVDSPRAAAASLVDVSPASTEATVEVSPVQAPLAYEQVALPVAQDTPPADTLSPLPLRGLKRPLSWMGEEVLPQTQNAAVERAKKAVPQRAQVPVPQRALRSRGPVEAASMPLPVRDRSRPRSSPGSPRSTSSARSEESAGSSSSGSGSSGSYSDGSKRRLGRDSPDEGEPRRHRRHSSAVSKEDMDMCRKTLAGMPPACPVLEVMQLDENKENSRIGLLVSDGNLAATAAAAVEDRGLKFPPLGPSDWLQDDHFTHVIQYQMRPPESCWVATPAQVVLMQSGQDSRDVCSSRDGNLRQLWDNHHIRTLLLPLNADAKAGRRSGAGTHWSLLVVRRRPTAAAGGILSQRRGAHPCDSVVE
ncbi:unnamed protein product, partial [Polarella glacialis]